MRNHKTIFSLTFLYSIVVIVWIQPFTESPINDDWAYLLTVKHYYQNHSWYFSYWQSMTLVGQSILGIIISKIVGFSIVNIRILTFSLSILALFLTYSLIWRISKNSNKSLIAWIVACCLPFTMHLSLSFMTEIYEWVGVLCSLLLFNYSLKNQNKKIWLLLISSCLFTVLIRQTSIIVPLSIFLVNVFLNDKKVSLTWSLLNSFLCVIAIVLCQNWQVSIQPDIRAHGVLTLLKNVVNHYPNVYIERIFGIVQLIGFFLIPLTLIHFKPSSFLSNWKLNFLILILLSPIFYFGFGNFPYGNTFTLFEWGPRFLKDEPYFFIKSDLPKSIRILLHFISLLSFSFWIVKLYNWIKNQGIRAILKLKPFSLLLLFVIVLNGIIHLLVPVFFDRHLFLTTQLIFLFILSSNLSEVNFLSGQSISKASIAFVFFFSLNLGMNRSYFSWLNAQKKLSDFALKHTDAKYIDGGQIFNGWHQTSSKTQQNLNVSWYHVHKDNWIISNNKDSTCKTINFLTYEKNLGFSVDTLYLLKR